MRSAIVLVAASVASTVTGISLGFPGLGMHRPAVPQANAAVAATANEPNAVGMTPSKEAMFNHLLKHKHQLKHQAMPKAPFMMRPGGMVMKAKTAKLKAMLEEAAVKKMLESGDQKDDAKQASSGKKESTNDDGAKATSSKQNDSNGKDTQKEGESNPTKQDANSTAFARSDEEQAADDSEMQLIDESKDEEEEASNIYHKDQKNPRTDSPTVAIDGSVAVRAGGKQEPALSTPNAKKVAGYGRDLNLMAMDMSPLLS